MWALRPFAQLARAHVRLLLAGKYRSPGNGRPLAGWRLLEVGIAAQVPQDGIVLTGIGPWSALAEIADAAQCGRGAPASAATTPTAPAASRV